MHPGTLFGATGCTDPPAQPLSSRPMAQSTVDLRLRIVALSLEPTLALARIAGLPLDELQQLVADGYFRELRLRGLSLEQVARRFGKSKRTVVSLSVRSQQEGPLLDESRRLGWQRQVVRLTSTGARSTEELRAVVGIDPE